MSGKDRELQALKHEVCLEVLNDFNSIDVEFHDREDLVWDRILSSRLCNLLLRGGEFVHE